MKRLNAISAESVNNFVNNANGRNGDENCGKDVKFCQRGEVGVTENADGGGRAHRSRENLTAYIFKV